MYRVLLADDEDFDLQGLQRFVPWTELGMEIVASVNSGFEALAVLRDEPVDLLVTDIRMPNMSGLELARKTLEMVSNIEIIFVSGYEDFHYARQALTLNAASYILKPVDDEELIGALKKVKARMDQRSKRKQSELDYAFGEPFIKNQVINNLLTGAVEKGDIPFIVEKLQLGPTESSLRAVIVEVDDCLWKLTSYEDQERNQILQELSSKLITFCNEQHVKHICKISTHRIGLIVDWSIEKCKDIFTDWVNMVQHSSCPLTITIAIGNAVPSIVHLNNSYISAEHTLDYKMFSGKSKVIDFSEVSEKQVQDNKNFELQLDALFVSISSYDLVRVTDEIEQLFTLLKSFRSKITIQHFVIHLIVRLDAYLHTLNENIYQMLGIEMRDLDILLQFETIDDIRSWLTRRLFEISELLQLKKEKGNQKLISKVIQYIDQEQCLQNNVSLKDIANVFSFSPNHLGYLFKVETGKSFTDYIIQLRLERARQLLQDPQLKVYEVADQVGYRNLTYFSRQFKKEFGVSPGDYRKQSS